MNQDCRPSDNCDEGRWQMFVPSNVWQDGGPIIEREGIALYLYGNSEWNAHIGGKESVGSTPLIAAMRCHVANKMGDEVEVPDELMEGEVK